jgi:hypothetical protein
MLPKTDSGPMMEDNSGPGIGAESVRVVDVSGDGL